MTGEIRGIHTNTLRDRALAAHAARRTADLAKQRLTATAQDDDRRAASAAWRNAEALEQLVSGFGTDAIIAYVAHAEERIASLKSQLAESETRRIARRRRTHVSIAEMCVFLQELRDGATMAEVARAHGRHYDGLRETIAGWHAGTTRLAQRGQQAGVWPTGLKEAP